jgi:2-succinyl-6-hydroxy-2,4-cyclohexadiene-1-carboxylate synthase
MAPDVVLLHGFTGSCRSFDFVSEALSRGGVTPIPVDLPGHGKRSGEIAASLFSLQSVFQSIAKASAVAPVSLVGYSMGGRLALQYAAAYPERVSRLVLESSSPGLDTDEERVKRREADASLAHRIRQGGVEAFVDEWEALPLFSSQTELPREIQATIRTNRLANSPRSLAAALEGFGTGSLPSLWGQIPTVTVPTLVLVGGLDAKFVEIGERMAGALPNARLTRFDSVGHAIHLEDPSGWIDAVIPFLLPA